MKPRADPGGRRIPTWRLDRIDTGHVMLLAQLAARSKRRARLVHARRPRPVASPRAAPSSGVQWAVVVAVGVGRLPYLTPLHQTSRQAADGIAGQHLLTPVNSPLRPASSQSLCPLAAQRSNGRCGQGHLRPRAALSLRARLSDGADRIGGSSPPKSPSLTRSYRPSSSATQRPACWIAIPAWPRPFLRRQVSLDRRRLSPCDQEIVLPTSSNLAPSAPPQHGPDRAAGMLARPAGLVKLCPTGI